MDQTITTGKIRNYCALCLKSFDYEDLNWYSYLKDGLPTISLLCDDCWHIRLGNPSLNEDYKPYRGGF